MTNKGEFLDRYTKEHIDEIQRMLVNFVLVQDVPLTVNQRIDIINTLNILYTIPGDPYPESIRNEKPIIAVRYASMAVGERISGDSRMHAEYNSLKLMLKNLYDSLDGICR